jgi:hypothetical protein
MHRYSLVPETLEPAMSREKKKPVPKSQPPEAFGI